MKGLKKTVTDKLRADLESLLESTAGFVAMADNAPTPEEAKYWLRRAHEGQRRQYLLDAASFIDNNEEDLLQYFADGRDIDPLRIDPVVSPVLTQHDTNLWRYASLTWSVPVSQGYGRRTKFLVRDRSNNKLIAIFALGDPVIGLQSRDQEIGWNKEQRHKRLYNVYDAFVLGAVEPYRQLLAGKLVALLATSNEVRRFLTDKYTGTSTVIRGESKNPTPALITTSSALGRSSVYNRLSFNGVKAFKSVGYTRGFGHFHISEEMFEQLVLLTQATGTAQTGKFGAGANYRFRVIRTALAQLGIDSDGLNHGIQREVFLAPVATNWKEFLCGETDDLHQVDRPAEEISSYFLDRWAIPRSERTNTFKEWNKNNMRLSNLLPNSSLQYSLFSALGTTQIVESDRSSSWHVGQAIVSQMDDLKAVDGTTISGVASAGQSRLSEVVVGKIRLLIAETTWNNGEREIQAVDRSDSPALVDSLIGRLRIGIYDSPLHEFLAYMELRVALRDSSGRAMVRKVSADQIEALVGLPLEQLFPPTTGTILGTREELFGDESRRRTDFCVLFPKDDHRTPATVWTLVRLLTFLGTEQEERNNTPTSAKTTKPKGRSIARKSTRKRKKP